MYKNFFAVIACRYADVGPAVPTIDEMRERRARTDAAKAAMVITTEFREKVRLYAAECLQTAAKQNPYETIDCWYSEELVGRITLTELHAKVMSDERAGKDHVDELVNVLKSLAAISGTTPEQELERMMQNSTVKAQTTSLNTPADG